MKKILWYMQERRRRECLIGRAVAGLSGDEKQAKEREWSRKIDEAAEENYLEHVVLQAKLRAMEGTQSRGMDETQWPFRNHMPGATIISLDPYN